MRTMVFSAGAAGALSWGCRGRAPRWDLRRACGDGSGESRSALSGPAHGRHWADLRRSAASGRARASATEAVWADSSWARARSRWSESVLLSCWKRCAGVEAAGARGEGWGGASDDDGRR